MRDASALTLIAPMTRQATNKTWSTPRRMWSIPAADDVPAPSSGPGATTRGSVRRPVAGNTQRRGHGDPRQGRSPLGQEHLALAGWRRSIGECSRDRVGDRRIHYDVAAVDFRRIIRPRHRSHGDCGLCDGVEQRRDHGDGRRQTTSRPGSWRRRQPLCDPPPRGRRATRRSIGWRLSAYQKGCALSRRGRSRSGATSAGMSADELATPFPTNSGRVNQMSATTCRPTASRWMTNVARRKRDRRTLPVLSAQ